MNSFWDRLSSRERKMAVAVGILLGTFLGMFLALQAITNLNDLDSTISSLEQTLLNYTEQNRRSVVVGKAYATVAEQHSSAWSEAEIHDRLRDEINRLSLENPPEPGEISKEALDQPRLVSIPTLRQGSLTDTGQGYREYNITFQVMPTDIESLTTFVERLLNSPQSLRIESLNMIRSPEGSLITANIGVTRTIVAGIGDDTAAPRPKAVEESAVPLFQWQSTNVNDWMVDGCQLLVATTVGELGAEGGDCIQVIAEGDQGSVAIQHQLDAGALYELSMDITGFVPGKLEVVTVADDKSFESPVEIPGDKKSYRYRMQFRVPGDGGKVEVLAPYITVMGKQGELFLDNVSITKETE